MQEEMQQNKPVRRGVVVACLAVLALAATQAQAALPSEATAAFTSLQGDAESLLSSAWPVVAAITVGFVLIGLFKRAAGKV